MTETYKIVHSHGRTERGIDTYDEAIARVREVYGAAAEVGHDGDISDGQDRTMVWIDEETSRGDDGARACCSIWRCMQEVA